MYKPMDVLLLESNAAHARIIARILRHESCGVVTALSTMDLTVAGANQAPQAIFIDAGFGGGAVAHIVGQLSARWPEAVLVIMSAEPQRQAGQISALRDKGARMLLKKPFNQFQAAEILTDIRAVHTYGDRRPHVVVLDDSQRTCQTTAELLRSFDLRVSTCLRGAETFERLEQEDVDVVLTDMNMPEMPGQEVIRQLNSSWRDIGVVAMSADERPHGPLSEAVRLGADAVVTKPFCAETLLDALGKAMHRRDADQVFI